MTKVGVHTIYMRKSHPDFAIAVQHWLRLWQVEKWLNFATKNRIFLPFQKVAILTCFMLKVLV